MAGLMRETGKMANNMGLESSLIKTGRSELLNERTGRKSDGLTNKLYVILNILTVKNSFWNRSLH
jgi:hypothetical protein